MVDMVTSTFRTAPRKWRSPKSGGLFASTEGPPLGSKHANSAPASPFLETLLALNPPPHEKIAIHAHPFECESRIFRGCSRRRIGRPSDRIAYHRFDGREIHQQWKILRPDIREREL